MTGRSVKGLATALAVLCLGGLSACGEDFPVEEGTSPLEVEVGEEFSWNDFHVEAGWTLKGVDRAVDMEQVTTPEVSGTIVNESDEERAAIFQLVFSTDGKPIATLNCSAGTMVKDQSMSLVCPGLNNTSMPEDYDAVVVQEFNRDTSVPS